MQSTTQNDEPEPVEMADRFERGELFKRAGLAAGAAIMGGSLAKAGSAWAAELGADLSLATDLSVWYLSQSPTEIKTVQDFSKLYGKKHGAKVNIAPYSFDAFNKAFPLALRGGKAPDVAYASPGKDTTVKFGQSGLLLDLTQISKERGWTKHIPAGLTAYVNAPDRHTWGIPFDVVTVGNFYNKEIFDEVGVKPPTTFAQYETMLAKLKAAGVTPFAVGGKDFTVPWMFDQIAHGLVPYPYLLRINYNLDPKATWKIAPLVRAATIVQNWAKKGYFQDNFLGQSTTDADNLFINGEAAIDVTGSWNSSNFIENAKFPVRFFATPQLNHRIPRHMGGFTPNNAWVVPKSGKNQAEALKYIDYVLSEQVARALWKTGDIVAYKFKKVPPTNNPLQRDVYAAMQKAQVGLYGFGTNAQFLQAGVSIMQELATSRTSPAGAIDKIEKAFRRAIAS